MKKRDLKRVSGGDAIRASDYGYNNDWLLKTDDVNKPKLTLNVQGNLSSGGVETVDNSISEVHVTSDVNDNINSSYTSTRSHVL